MTWVKERIQYLVLANNRRQCYSSTANETLYFSVKYKRNNNVVI